MRFYDIGVIETDADGARLLVALDGGIARCVREDGAAPVAQPPVSFVCVLFHP
jgi:hypothetical protein